MGQIQIIPFKGNARLNEIYQSMGLKIALLRDKKNNVFEQITPLVKCRDFLCDVHSASKEGKDFTIYGMSWKGSTDQPDWEGPYLLLHFPSDEAQKYFKQNLRILNDIEQKNNYFPTEFESVDSNSGVVVGASEWLHNTLTFSLYTFLLRVFCYEVKTKDWITELGIGDSSDSKYVASVDRSVWDTALNSLSSIHTDRFCGLSFDTHGTAGVHHNSGFISVFGSHTELSPKTVRLNEHWKEMKKRGFKLHTT